MSTLILDKPFVSAGLPSYTYTIPTTGFYNVQLSYTMNPPTGLSVVVNQNGTPVYTAPTPSATQGHNQYKVELNCTAADVITVVFSSSTPIDKQLNTIQSTVTIGAGA